MSLGDLLTLEEDFGKVVPVYDQRNIGSGHVQMSFCQSFITLLFQVCSIPLEVPAFALSWPEQPFLFLIQK